jgi:hypothetical protein
VLAYKSAVLAPVVFILGALPAVAQDGNVETDLAYRRGEGRLHALRGIGPVSRGSRYLLRCRPTVRR